MGEQAGRPVGAHIIFVLMSRTYVSAIELFICILNFYRYLLQWDKLCPKGAHFLHWFPKGCGQHLRYTCLHSMVGFNSRARDLPFHPYSIGVLMWV